MLIVLIALIIGLLIGLFSTTTMPAVFYPYITLIILASFNTLIEIARAKFSDSYQSLNQFLAWLTDIILVVAFNALGDALGVDLATPVIIYLGANMFYNLRKIRKTWFRHQERKRKALQVWVEEEDSVEDLPLEAIDTDAKSFSRAESLRVKAKKLRVEADSLVNEADALEEKEAMDQLTRIRNKNSQLTENSEKAEAKGDRSQKPVDHKPTEDTESAAKDKSGSANFSSTRQEKDEPKVNPRTGRNYKPKK